MSTSPSTTKSNEEETSSPPPRRINVAINADTLAAIENVIEREQVSLTEAVRRLLSFGDFLYRATRDEESTILIRAAGGNDREVILV